MNVPSEQPGAPGVPVAGFPGGTAVTHLRVYDWPATDGQAGGSPHLHTASAEGYVVIRGEGTLETLSSAGFKQLPLHPGTLLWFTPGTVHRLVNHSGDLELLVVMQNAGLPEAGDAVLTYPLEVLADADAYRNATAIPAADEFDDAASAHAAMSQAARRRRDLAIDGYLQIRDRIDEEGPGALAELHAAAVRLVQDKASGWRHLWEERPYRQAVATGTHLDDLASGRATHLHDATVFTTQAPRGPLNGMCGLLSVWDLDGARPLE